MSCLLSLALLLFISQSSHAVSPVTLSDITAEYLLGSHLEMLRDPSGKLTIEEVTSPEASPRFVPVAEKNGNRLDVTVISDTVNVAARLESLTKDRDESIIISGSVVKSLQHPEQFALQELGTASIKGRTNVVEIWGVRKDRAQAV